MNGNKVILPLILFIMIIGCSASKNATGSGETVVIENGKNTTEPTTGKTKTLTEVLKDQASKPDSLPRNLTDSTFNRKYFTYKESYNIALMLPLMLNSIDGDTAKSPYINPGSKIGVEFYKGALMALDTLQAKGLNAKIHLLDSQNDDQVVKDMLTLGKLEHMDLVIGPVFNGQARLVADYCKRKNITMIAPLSPSDNITTRNPSFVMANPRLNVHCEALFNFAADSFWNANYIVVYQDNAVEGKYAKLFDKLVADYNANPQNNKQVKITKVALKSKGISADLNPYMVSGKKNVIIIPSVDLPFLVNLSREIYGLVSRHELVVMGMPLWGTDENLRMDYVNAMKVHFTSPYYVQSEFYVKDAPLRKAFIDRFGSEPTENTIKGYDLVNYLGELILDYGVNYKDMMLVDYASAWHTAYKFRPYTVSDATTGKDAVEYIENKHVNILKYEDYNLTLVNWRSVR